MSLRIGLINIQGLQSEQTNKINSPEFIKICENHDILLLTETWTSDLCDVSIDGFDHIVLNRTEKKPGTRRNSGGLIVYIKSCFFDNNTCVKCDGDDIIWFKLKGDILRFFTFHCKFLLYVGLYVFIKNPGHFPQCSVIKWL